MRIDAQRVNRILAAFDAAHFENLPSAKEGERLRRRAGIRAGEYSREVFDTWESDEETEGKKEKRKENALEKLVNSIFTIVMPVAKKGGPGAASLSGGLKAIASNQLAPETLTIILLVKPEMSQSEAGSGFLLHIADGYATSTPYGAQGQNPARIKLTDSQIRDIAGRLATVEPETLPANLYATNYEDLTITIFNRRKNVMARQFAAMTPTKFGEAQKRFDTLIAWLEEKRATLFPQSPSAQ